VTSTFLICLYLGALAGLLGLELIRKAPPTLHAALLTAVGALGGLGGLAALHLERGLGALAGVAAAIGAAGIASGLLDARRTLRR
jgi:hypothetical protein